MNWKEYFDNLARNEVEEHKKSVGGTKESMYAKFYPLFHVGSGNGALEEIAINYPHVEIYGVDISGEMLKICKAKRIQNAEFLFGSITQIPFKDTKFDVLVSIGVLQNFNGSLDKAVSELCGVVRAGARSISLLDIESMKRGMDFILPLHATHIFFILAKQEGREL